MAAKPSSMLSFNLHAICKSYKQDIIHEEEAAEAALNDISQMQG
jgi:hypothetical protein